MSIVQHWSVKTCRYVSPGSFERDVVGNNQAHSSDWLTDLLFVGVAAMLLAGSHHGRGRGTHQRVT